jgi:hypothetical protein
MPQPVGVTIDSKDYLLVSGQDSFELIGEPRLEQQGDIAGASRPAKTPRPDILIHKWDNWSGGEGQRFINSEDPESFTRYQDGGIPASGTGLGTVDIGTIGEIRRGRQAEVVGETNFAGVSPTVGFLLIFDTGVYSLYNDGADIGYASCTSATANFVHIGDWLTGANLKGPPASDGNLLFAGTTIGLYRSTGSGTGADWTAAAAIAHGNPIISSNRIYFTKEVTGGVELYQGSLTTANQEILVGTTPGAKSVATCSDGDNVYLLTSNSTANRCFLHRWDGTTLTEFAAMPQGFRVIGDHRPVMKAAHGIVFVGGYRPGDNTNEFDRPTLLYFTESDSGTVVTREASFSLRTAGGKRISSMEFIDDDTLVMGLRTGASDTSVDYFIAYDMRTGGLSDFMRSSGSFSVATSAEVTSVVSNFGRVWGYVYGDDATDTHAFQRERGRILITGVAGSIWDFDLPDEEKLLLSCEVHTSALVAADSEVVSLSFKLDDSTIITTDAAGAGLTHSTNLATRASFTLSNASSERVFRFVEPRIQVGGTASDQSKRGPKLYSVTIRATTMGMQQFIACRVDLSDSRGDKRPMSRALTGERAQEELETLMQDTTNRVFTLKPKYEKAPAPREPSFDSYTVVPYSYRFGYHKPGQGMAELVFRVLA